MTEGRPAVFLPFALIQAAAVLVSPAVMALLGASAPERPVAIGMMLLVMAAPGILLTSGAAAIAVRLAGRLSLPAVGGLALLWGMVGTCISIILASPDNEAHRVHAGVLLALLTGCAAMPLLAAWWWSRPSAR